MKLTVLPWVLGATVDGGLDSRLRGNDGSQGLQRLKRDCPVPEGRTIAKSPSRMIGWESDGRNFPVSTFSVAEISPSPLRQAQVRPSPLPGGRGKFISICDIPRTQGWQGWQGWLAAVRWAVETEWRAVLLTRRPDVGWSAGSTHAGRRCAVRGLCMARCRT